MDNLEKLATQGTQNKRRRQTKQKHNTICFGNYAQANTNNVNKTWALLQTAGDKDGPNIVFMRKSYRTSQDGIQNLKTPYRTTQNAKNINVFIKHLILLNIANTCYEVFSRIQ